ncbi:NAD(P)/FAD-dependent oxidoreductase [Actinobacillus pleuropneumoniae]|uniref:NAD(P)/FAD-dependent oxidoreductase n=1 Tax=Actinobacillus pleuropneumoniae TaxID=715 RepID=UPI003F7C1BB6
MSDNIQNFDLTRRLFLQSSALGLTATASGLLLPKSALAEPKVSAAIKIVIAGGGAAGLATASRLAERLDEKAEIIVIEPNKHHIYQPGFTLIAAGLKPADYSVSDTGDYLPPQVKWIEAKVEEFNPDANQVRLSNGENLNYDYLFVTTGLKLDYDAIEGMDTKLIGTNGLGSIYHSAVGAEKTWKLLDEFSRKGGNAVLLRPNTEMKCSGAPLKYTFIVRDYLHRRGTLAKSHISYNSNNGSFFSVPIVSEKVRMMFEARDIHYHYHRILKAIDPAKRIATFESKDEGKVELPYDFINVIPPQVAPDAVRNSPLAWQTGPWKNEGWMEVSKSTLRHVRYPNVFGVGDIAGVPKGKTAASVKWQVPVAVDHLICELQGKESQLIYNGYTSCPLITEVGRAMLVEFDYNNNLQPSFPGIIHPLEDSWTSWLLETIGLKPTYLSMLRGKA